MRKFILQYRSRTGYPWPEVLFCALLAAVTSFVPLEYVSYKKNKTPKKVLSKINIQALLDLHQMLYLNHIRWLIFSQKCVLFCLWHYFLYSFRNRTISSLFTKLLPCSIKIFTLLSSHHFGKHPKNCEYCPGHSLNPQCHDRSFSIFSRNSQLCH